MTPLLSSLFGRIREWVVIAFVAVATIVGVYLKGRSDGGTLASSRAKDALIDDIKTQKEIRDEVASLSDDDLSRRLSKWTRQ